jgi:hypothetical protein
MKRAHPASLRTSLEAGQALVKIGVEFVPIPVMSAQDHCDLAAQMLSRLESLTLQAEVEEAGATAQDKPNGPSSRDKIEAIALDNVLVHTPLYALRAGMISSYQEALEQMVLSMSKHHQELIRWKVSAQVNSPMPLCNVCACRIPLGTTCDCVMGS